MNAPAAQGKPGMGNGGGKGMARMMGGPQAAAGANKDKDMFQYRGMAGDKQAEAKKAVAGRDFRFKDDRRVADLAAGAAAAAKDEKEKMPALGLMKQMGGGGGMMGRRFDLRGGLINGGGRGLALNLPAMPVRVFAHSRANGPAEVRYDFAETLYWHPVLVLPGGKADVSFDLCDSLGAFELTAFAHTLDGRLGSATKILTSRLPLAVSPRIPLEVTAGDKIDIALSVANNTSEKRTAHVSVLEHGNLSLLSGTPSTDDVSVPAESALRKLYRFRPTVQEGEATLAFTAKADGVPADTMRTTFRIVPEGFPDRRRPQRYSGEVRHARSRAPRYLDQGHSQMSGGCLPVHAGRFAKGVGIAPARTGRLLRADLDEQLPEPAHLAVPQGERSDQAGSRTPCPRVARPRLSAVDLVRVPEYRRNTPRKATSGSAAPPRPTRR